MIRYNTKEFSGLKFFSSFGKWAEEHGSLWSFSWADFWEWGCWRIRTFGFVFPKYWQHSFKCLCPDPVLQALRWLCTSVLSYTIKAECLTQCLVAAPHSQQRERTCCRQLQSVLLLSTHFTGKKGYKYPWAVLILPCNLKCWVSKQVAGTVLGLQNTLRALNNVRFLYEQKKYGWGIRSCSSSSLLNIPSAAVKENQSRVQQIGPRRISTISLCCSSFAFPNKKRKERKASVWFPAVWGARPWGMSPSAFLEAMSSWKSRQNCGAGNTARGVTANPTILSCWTFSWNVTESF